ncbi:hypothetical protein AAGG49_22570, partial [Stenotrophomonas maltophilia]|uniref:hypothetical protein n=1 Tax=Stenotrophomonas maltophilia TaxID=40324 RepID=UPI00313C91D8
GGGGVQGAGVVQIASGVAWGAACGDFVWGCVSGSSCGYVFFVFGLCFGFFILFFSFNFCGGLSF